MFRFIAVIVILGLLAICLQYLQFQVMPDSYFLLGISVTVNQLARLFTISCNFFVRQAFPILINLSILWIFTCITIFKYWFNYFFTPNFLASSLRIFHECFISLGKISIYCIFALIYRLVVTVMYYRSCHTAKN